MEENDDICSVAKDGKIQILNALRGMTEILGPGNVISKTMLSHAEGHSMFFESTEGL